MSPMLAVMSAAALVLTILAWRMRRADRRRSGARVAALAAAIDPGADQGTPLLFSPERSSFADDHPLLRVAAALVLVVTLALIATLLTYDRGTTSPALETSAARTPPLALLSMRHERHGDTLTVTGLVRNPGALPAEGITVIVFAFDRSGAFVASARAALDFRTLRPGEESPFRVAVPHAVDIGRYRVSFRDESGVVRHVDRRKRGTSSSVASRDSAGVRRADGES